MTPVVVAPGVPTSTGMTVGVAGFHLQRLGLGLALSR